MMSQKIHRPSLFFRLLAPPVLYHKVRLKRLAGIFLRKRRLVIFLFPFFSATLAKAQHPEKTIGKIKQLEIDWHHAYVTHDSIPLENILADDFINLGRTGGRANKQQVLENFKKDSAVYEYCEPYDFEFRVYKKTVIVLCKSREKGMDNGKPFSNNYFSYDVFIKRHGKWQCVQAGVNLLKSN